MALTDANANASGLHVSFKGLGVDGALDDDNLTADGPIPAIEEEWKPEEENNANNAEVANDRDKPVVPNMQAGVEAPKKKKKKRKSKGSRKFVSTCTPSLPFISS